MKSIRPAAGQPQSVRANKCLKTRIRRTFPAIVRTLVEVQRVHRQIGSKFDSSQYSKREFVKQFRISPYFVISFSQYQDAKNRNFHIPP